MERLTEKCWRNLDPWETCGQDKFCTRRCHDKGGCANGCRVPKLYRKLADYEDAEEQGLLLRLPCKEDDVAWCALEDTRYYYGGVYEVTVEEVEWSSGSNFEVMVRFKEGEQPCGHMRFHSFEFGEKIFFGDNAKIEAEQALADMKKGK